MKKRSSSTEKINAWLLVYRLIPVAQIQLWPAFISLATNTQIFQSPYCTLKIFRFMEWHMEVFLQDPLSSAPASSTAAELTFISAMWHRELIWSRTRLENLYWWSNHVRVDTPQACSSGLAELPQSSPIRFCCPWGVNSEIHLVEAAVSQLGLHLW